MARQRPTCSMPVYGRQHSAKSGRFAVRRNPTPAELQPAEITLVDLMARLPDEVQKAAADYKPMTIANLAYDLAKAFNDFYKDCPVSRRMSSPGLSA